MTFRNKIFLLFCLCAICVLPICSSAALPLVNFPLKPSPSEGPYQDTEFLEKANETIYTLSNQSVPNGTGLLELQSVQQQLAKMNVSKELHPVASDINAFLYYTGRAGSEYGDSVSFTSSLLIPASQGASQLAEAIKYYQAATEVWKGIQEMYPNVTIYTMNA